MTLPDKASQRSRKLWVREGQVLLRSVSLELGFRGLLLMVDVSVLRDLCNNEDVRRAAFVGPSGL